MIDIACPGAINLRLEVKNCPSCGGEVEIFSDEYMTHCPDCGAELFRDNASCIDWCPYAKKCLDVRNKRGSVLVLK